MDIFKLLSRSTKLRKPSANTSTSRKVPSSGQNANPQLFGHELPAKDHHTLSDGNTSLGKRKRSGSGQEIGAHVPHELDFFEDKTGKSKHQKRQSEQLDAKNGHSEAAKLITAELKQATGNDDRERRNMDSEASKRILRSHKIKITVLAGSEQHAYGIRVSNKKKSNQQTKGKEKPQVYPKPLSSFSELRSRYGIDRRLGDNIHNQGYTTPTEVQLAALPLLLGESSNGSYNQEFVSGEKINLLAIAPTGSGKTLAFLIPIIDSLAKGRRKGMNDTQVNASSKPAANEGPRAIILAPTKELANQIVNEGRKLCLGMGLRIILMRKGMSFANADHDEDLKESLFDATEDDSTAFDENNESQPFEEDEISDSDGIDGDESDRESALNSEPRKRNNSKRKNVPKSDILVSTPLTTLHAIQIDGKRRYSLPKVRHLVLDEADVLLDPLFREQTLDIWHACTNLDLRVSLWSATMASSIESLAMDEIAAQQKASEHQAHVLRLVVGIKDTALPNITHTLTYAATEAGKLLALRQLLHPTSASTDSEGRKSLRPPFLVFTQTIPRAIALYSELKYDIPPEAGGSSRIAVLHSGLSEGARSRVMAGFRRGEIWVIITTDLLARGVDFRGLNGVVNYDVPTSAAAYVHRVGRTGRAGREGGVAVTFYTKEDIPYVKAIANVIAASEKLRERNGENVAEGGVQQWLLDALPTPSKRDKKELKRRGVESRRIGVKAERISTKSVYDRRKESMRKSSKQPRARKSEEVEYSEFEGFD